MNVLELLSENNYISGQTLAKKLKISRAAVNKQINILRRSGYSIDGIKNLGYKLISVSSDEFTAQKVISAASQVGLISKTIFFTKTNSTQTQLKKNADVYSDGTLIIASEQSSAYGRMERKWSASSGGLWFSILLKPKMPLLNVAQISLVASLSVAQALINLGFSAQIKWPNDIFISGKKVCGILVETAAEADMVRWVTLGIGLNINNILPSDLLNTSTTLSLEKKSTVSRVEILREVLIEFEKAYNKFLKDGFVNMKDNYNEHSYLINKNVKVASLDGEYFGKAIGVDSYGRLLVEQNGEVSKFLSGDVSVRIK